MGGCVIVQHDPSGLYSPGARFTMLDLASGVRQATWPMGIEFTIKDQPARMLGKILIREDRYMLDTNRSGSYEWRELTGPGDDAPTNDGCGMGTVPVYPRKVTAQ